MSTRVLILGATGQIARHVIHMLAGNPSIHMTLYARSPQKLDRPTPANAEVVAGDVLDATKLGAAMSGQDIVYANLTGDNLDVQAAAVLTSMKYAKVKRLVFVLALGIYDELPPAFQKWNEEIIGEDLKSFRRAAKLIEGSETRYTILRPAWLTEADEVDYETTALGETFKGTEVSRKSVGHLITRIIVDPSLHVGANLGVNKPGTDGDKPSFY